MGLGGGAASSLRGKEKKQIKLGLQQRLISSRLLNSVSSAPDKHSLGGVERWRWRRHAQMRTHRDEMKNLHLRRVNQLISVTREPGETGETWRSLERVERVEGLEGRLMKTTVRGINGSFLTSCS